jgi:molecular chaperone DnaK (HSP70)
MTARAVIVTVVLLTLASCRKPAATNATPGALPGTSSAPSASAALDYRTYNQGAIEVVISQATGGSFKLQPAGKNRYTGTRPSPDGTIQIPVTVTVEATRIVIESSGGGLTSRDVIDADGKLHSDLR